MAALETKQFVREDSAALQHVYPGAFTAVDLHAVVTFPGGIVRTLGNLMGLSISTHRDAFPVTALNRVSPRGFTRGHRTVAGTLVFHVLDRSAFAYGVNPSASYAQINGKDQQGLSAPDALPLFDVHLTYVNESGDAAFEALYGIVLLDSGKTISLENLEPVEQFSYMALEYLPLAPIGRKVDTQSQFRLQKRPNRELQPLRSRPKGHPDTTFDPAIYGINT